MKNLKVLILSIFTIVYSVNAQSEKEFQSDIENIKTDILEQRNNLLSLESDVKDINLRLEEYRSNYFTGIRLNIIGSLWSIAGSTILILTPPKDKNHVIVPSVIMMSVGTTLSITGIIKTITSHNKLKSDW